MGSPTIRETFQRNLRRLRDERGMTQLELGRALGLDGHVATQAISKLECGEKWVSDARLSALAAALGVHPSDLLRDDR